MRKYKNNKKYLLYILAIISILGIGVGYSRLNETLTVSSTAKFSPIPVLKSTTSMDTTAFRSSTYKEKIKSITFENEINVPDNAIESWDVSEQQNGAYMAYVVPNEADSTYYDLYIQGDGKIYANENMSYWFSGLTYVDAINNLELLETEHVTNMGYLFYKTGYESTVFMLSVNSFNTRNVTNMAVMFYETGYNSTNFTLDISNFDTGNVLNMTNMFYETGYKSAIFTLKLGEFDTSKVTNMEKLFQRAGYSSTKFNASITIKNPNTTSYTSMFTDVATKEGSQITVNYTSETSDLVDAMIATKSANSNVVKGVQVD